MSKICAQDRLPHAWENEIEMRLDARLLAWLLQQLAEDSTEDIHLKRLSLPVVLRLRVYLIWLTMKNHFLKQLFGQVDRDVGGSFTANIYTGVKELGI